MSKQKILFVTPVVPLPPTGGGTRSFHFLKAASEAGRVDLICLQQLDKAAIELLQPYCNSILHKGQQVQAKSNALQKFYYRICMLLPFLFSPTQLNHELGFFVRQRWKQLPLLRNIYFKWLLWVFQTKKPLPTIAYQLNIHDAWWQQKFQEIAQMQYDVLLIDFTYMGFLPSMLPINSYKRIVFNAHNAEYEIIEQSIQLAEDVAEKKWMTLQVQLMKKTETASAATGNQIFCCSAHDKIKFEQLNPSAIVHIIPNGVDLDYFKPGPVTASDHILLFTGTMNYHPNEDAVNWFVKDILPSIKQEVPSVQLFIAGKKANTISTNGHSNVRLINDPIDMRPIFQQAAVVIVPLRIGSGTRLKILEAAAMQKAIVTTSVGSEGLEGISKEVLVTANTAEAFALSVVQLLKSAQHREQLGKTAGAWVGDAYSWKQIRCTISTLLKAA
jgi:polysaccharide biosynthesis protein PslH